jgi:hypothetical protein
VDADQGKGGEKMKKRITLLIAALMLALSMALSGAAFADPPFTTENPGGQEQGCGGNNPNCETLNRGGNPPGGFND